MRHRWTWAVRRLCSVAGIAAVLGAGACAPTIPQLPANDILDRYQTGMQKLEQNDFAGAGTLFIEAIEQGSGMPHGHTGMTYLMLARASYREALHHAEDAIEIDPSFVDALAAKGRVLTVRKRGDWRREALEPLNAALGQVPDDPRVLYYLGELHFKAREYGKAIAAYELAAQGAGPFAASASGRITVIGPFVDDPPRTDEALRLLLDDKIDRAGLCALIEEDLGITGLLKRLRPDIYRRVYMEATVVDAALSPPPDVRKHRYESNVCTVLPLAFRDLRVLPDGRFYPDRIITRAQLAVVMQAVLVMVSGNDLHATRFVGARSKFPDIRPDFYAFNAVMLCVDRGIMSADPATNAFRPGDPVSGLTTLSALRGVEVFLTGRE